MKQIGRYWVPDSESIQLEALAGGGWQLDHLREALFHVKRWHVAVDGGAHVGSWTLEMARFFETVLAFEPCEESYDCLKRNTATAFNVQAIRCALGKEEGKMRMGEDSKYSNSGNTGGRYLMPKEMAGVSDFSARVKPLDLFNLRRLDFLKLDVEGFEYFALLGAKETLKRCRPVVLLEVKHRMAARYGLQANAAGNLLEMMGMVHLGHTGSDHWWGWE